MFVVLSGNAGKSPVLIQFYKTQKAAEAAAKKRRAAWQVVKTMETQKVSFSDLSTITL